MDAAFEAKLKSYARLGTFLVDLPGLAKAEGVACAVQMRRLRGESYSAYLRDQNKLVFANNKLRQERTRAADHPDGPEAGTAPGGMSEAEEKNLFLIVASMRSLLQHSVMRVFVDAPDSVQVYKVSLGAVGDHEENEISIDLLEKDYATLVNRLLVKSGLIPDTPFPATEPGDAADPGPSGEAVRPAAEPVGEGVPSGSTV